MNAVLKDIKLYSNKELLDELAQRYDHALFSGIQIINTFGQTRHEQRFKGNTLLCCGMTDMMKHFLVKQYNEGLAYYEGPGDEDYK